MRARIPPGVQLGRRPPYGAQLALDAALVVLAVAVVAGAVSLFRLRAEGAPARPAPGAPASPGGSGPEAREALRESALLAQSGALGAVRLGEVFETARAAAPPTVRIVGITVRPERGPDGRAVAETSLSARAPDAEAVAGLLGALLRSEAVSAAEVISERRQRDGSVVVEITSRITTGGAAAPDAGESPGGMAGPGAAR